MSQLNLPLNIQTQAGHDKAILHDCRCVKDKTLRVTRKPKNATQKPDQLELFSPDTANETGS